MVMIAINVPSSFHFFLFNFKYPCLFRQLRCALYDQTKHKVCLWLDKLAQHEGSWAHKLYISALVNQF